MTTIKLSTVKAATEAKYGSFVIDLEDGKDAVTLRHPINMSDEERAALVALSSSPDKEGDDGDVAADQTAQLLGMLELASATVGQYERLIAALSPNGYPELGLLSEITTGWMENQKVGEASASQD